MTAVGALSLIPAPGVIMLNTPSSFLRLPSFRRSFTAIALLVPSLACACGSDEKGQLPVQDDCRGTCPKTASLSDLEGSCEEIGLGNAFCFNDSGTDTAVVCTDDGPGVRACAGQVCSTDGSNAKCEPNAPNNAGTGGMGGSSNTPDPMGTGGTSENPDPRSCPGVELFLDANYEGESACITEEGNFSLGDLRALGIENDELSSLKIAPGYEATLYWDNAFLGQTILKANDTPDLKVDEWDDQTSSLEITRGCGATELFSESAFEGALVCLGEGRFDRSDLAELGMSDDELSSLKVRSGYEVTLYQDEGFAGDTLVVTSDVSDLQSATWDEATSSVAVGRIMECTPGASRCQGFTVLECSDQGQWYGLKRCGDCIESGGRVICVSL